MANLIVDASVAAKWMREEENSDHAGRLLDSPLTLMAPDLVIPELGNVIRNWCRSGAISEALGRDLTDDLPGIGLKLVASSEVVSSALELALAYNRSLYDSLYVALAQREACQLVTADLRLYNALKDSLPERMLWIGDI